MIPVVTMKLEGFAELKEQLDEFEKKATQTNVIKRALLKSTAPIESAARAKAPKLSGILQRSIGTGTKLSRRQKELYKKVNKVEIFVGAGALKQAVTQEFGTVHFRAQPFLRPAWESNWRNSLNIFRDELAVEIDKAAQRAARKAAKEIAKMR